MKYSDILHFEPIETVIQLSQAETEIVAKQLVKNFVISDKLAEQLIHIAFSQLQFVQPYAKGILIVGNYGTGKSHLMSVITSLAEYPELNKEIKHESVFNKSKEMISGNFKVIRIEIGSTRASLRDIVCDKVEQYLSQLNIDFVFPQASEIVNNKDSFMEMMALFQEKYPDYGLIIAIDELLDYLRSRDDQDLILDLNFFRELGELCSISRLRIVAGLQESLFDNPKFEFLAGTMKRVKDRFVQIRISNEDIAYVVSERLLKKDQTQNDIIRNHLKKFSKVYENMTERLDDFIKLFPIHPAYLEIFEDVHIAEKREILSTISSEIKKILDKDIPVEEPGIIAYDSYWNVIRENPIFRIDPDVRVVLEVSDILERKVLQSMTKNHYKPMALRIIHAMSVHRLSTVDIYDKIGVTAEELRDNLCLYIQLPIIEADFLKTTIDTILREIMNTVSGSYISISSENSQYYLDLKKNIDYDSTIRQRGEILDKNKLNRYYFDSLAKIMECTDTTYVQGFKIWEHEIEWIDKGVTKKGYLFFGAPNERSTAQPPRDFYLYFLQLFDIPKFKDEKKSDEVFYKLTYTEDFTESLKLYAGAKEMADNSSPGNKRLYETKAINHFQTITKWLLQNINTAFEVNYKGINKKLINWMKRGTTTAPSFKDHINNVASLCLSSHFEDISPEYPKFSILVTDANRSEYVYEALRWMKGIQKTKNAYAVLNALELLNDEYLQSSKSKYAKHILTLLQKKARGQVVNRNQILTSHKGVVFENKYKLEPEWVIVILAALAYSGDIVISYPGKKIDASNLDELVRMEIDDLLKFNHIEHPKDVPVNVLINLFDILEIPSGLITNPANRDEAVKELQRKIPTKLNHAIILENNIQQIIPGLDINLLNDKEIEEYKNIIHKYIKFLESLKLYNNVGKLKNFLYNVDELNSQKQAIKVLEVIEEINTTIQKISPLSLYLSSAELVLPKEHSWSIQFNKEKKHIISGLQDPNIRRKVGYISTVLKTLTDLKRKYILEYNKLHDKARLNDSEAIKKSKLLEDPRITRLDRLALIDLLPRDQLIEVKNSINMLKSCSGRNYNNLENQPFCPECDFRQRDESITVDVNLLLIEFDEKIDFIENEWIQTLIQNLSDPSVKKNLTLLTDEEKEIISQILEKKELPSYIDDDFIKTLEQVFSELEKVEIKLNDLKNILIGEGMPCTPLQLENRFNKFLDNVLNGKDKSLIRIILT